MQVSNQSLESRLSQSNLNMAPLRIAVVGAGPVGLTLARFLLNK